MSSCGCTAGGELRWARSARAPPSLSGVPHLRVRMLLCRDGWIRRGSRTVSFRHASPAHALMLMLRQSKEELVSGCGGGNACLARAHSCTFDHKLVLIMPSSHCIRTHSCAVVGLAVVMLLVASVAASGPITMIMPVRALAVDLCSRCAADGLGCQEYTVMRRGAGPVGTLAAYCAFHRGASRVLIIDEVFPGLHVSHCRLMSRPAIGSLLTACR